MKKIAIISFATIFLTCLYPFDTSTYERSLDFSNTLSCSDVDITFRSSIWEETQDSAYELPNRQIALKDLGQEGGFTGETFTIDYETILSGNVRNILEISITLNSGHNAVLTATYNRSEDDEDEKDTYDLSEYFKATNVPLTSSSTNKLTFRIDGEEVCNKIEEYRYQQNRSATAWTIRTIDHCDEESFLEIKFTCTGIITQPRHPAQPLYPPLQQRVRVFPIPLLPVIHRRRQFVGINVASPRLNSAVVITFVVIRMWNAVVMLVVRKTRYVILIMDVYFGLIYVLAFQRLSMVSILRKLSY